MSTLNLFLGLAGIALGANQIAKGVKRLSGSSGQQVPAGVRRGMVNGIPTIYVPRSATRKQGSIAMQGAHVNTTAGPMRYTEREVNTLGDRLATILDLAEKGKQDPKVIAWVRGELSRKCGPGWNGEQWCVREKDKKSEAVAIFKAIRRDVRYLNDIVGKDTYAAPRQALKTKAEDCDGYAALTCAAMEIAGIECRAKVIRTKRSSSPDHIFNEIMLEGAWVPMDASTNMGPFWEAPKAMVAEQWIYALR